MSEIYEGQIKEMQRLINYGVNENRTVLSTPLVEYHAKAADGKTYGIIREGRKFYIKVAPKKDTPVLAEDYDYIGGYMNKKANEYLTYAAASKNLDLKIMNINESLRVKERVSQYKEQEASDWQVNETKEMRSEIDRFNEIVNNSVLIEEGKSGGFTEKHTLPEAPAQNPSDKKVNSPFTDTAVAKGDKEFTKQQTDQKKAGDPYNKDGEATNKDMQSDKNPKGNDGDTYSEKAKYVPDGAVANQHKDGGKAVKMNEGRTVKLTKAQVLAWNKSKDFMDKTHGTEIGSSAPYTDEVGKESNQTSAPTEKIHEDANVVHNTDNQNSPTPGTTKVETSDGEPFIDKVNEDTVDVNNVAGFKSNVPFPEVEPGGAYLDFEKDFNDWETQQDAAQNPGLEAGFDDLDLDADLYDLSDAPFELDGAVSDDEEDKLHGYGEDDRLSDDQFEEGKQKNGNKVNEGTVLDDFGKHPAYQKVPMTTPPNKEIDKFGKDWNDDSAKGEKPYGQQIGDTAPFTELIDQLTDSIMKHIDIKKKV